VRRERRQRQRDGGGETGTAQALGHPVTQDKPTLGRRDQGGYDEADPGRPAAA
jgi:hypothetical protein